MKRLTIASIVACLAGALSLALAAPSAHARAGAPLAPRVSAAVTPVVSAPLADLPALPDLSAEALKREPRAIPNRPIPRPGRSTRPADPSFVFVDPMLPPPLPPPSPTLATIRSFDGLDSNDNAAILGYRVAPPDTDGAVGPNHYVQMVNTLWAVYDKGTGVLLGGPWPNNNLWVAANTNDACENSNDGDPVVLYDRAADRWLISQFALPNFPDGPFYECIAISQSPDPLGSWYLYTFQTSATKMDDYPKFGVWPDGYYMSVNQFTAPALNWGGTGAGVFERSQMLAGAAARLIYFDNASDVIGGLLPTNLEGGTPPPAGAPNLFVQVSDSAWATTPSDALRLWEFHVDWTTPANSTFTLLGDLNTAAFDANMCSYSRDCIPQPGTTQRVDAISDRLMFLLNYRNFGTHESMVVNHTVDAGGDHAGIRWYELRDSGSGWAIHQQGTYSPDAAHRWMGSMSIDGEGNIGLGYSVSSSTTYPSVRFTGRLAGDALGTMTLGENSIVEGTGSQLGVSRWGDYSAMLVDPFDECTFWYTQEYVKTTGSFNWATRIGAFKIPGCGANWGSLGGQVTDGVNPIQGAVVTITGGAVVSTDANGDYLFPSLPAGYYDMTVTRYGYGDGAASGVLVVDGAPTVQNFVLTANGLSTVSGTVTDALTGAPLVAQIAIPEYPGSPIFSNAAGQYSVDLENGTDHHFTVTSAGYSNATATVTPAGSPVVRDFPLAVDVAACNAPGYGWVSGFSQDFNAAGFPPGGWTVADLAGTGVVWKTNGDWFDGNYTGGTGAAADVNSDEAGTMEYDTTLTSPAITVAGLPGTFLTYRSNYQNFAGRDFLDLDINVDGAGWTNLLSWNEDHGTFKDTPGEKVVIDLSPYLSGAASFQLRWHYYDPLTSDWNWYAQVDDPRIGTCVPTTTRTLRSQGSFDGWVLESGEFTGTGGTKDAASRTLRLGDDASRRQYRSVLSFATGGIPDGASIVKVTLKVRRQGTTGGGNPFGMFSGLKAEVKKGFFGTGPRLAAADFQAPGATGFGLGSPAPVGGWYTFDLTGAKNLVNKLASRRGVTQVRLRFNRDDNNNAIANYLSLHSGNALRLIDRPVLIVEYVTP